MGWGGQKHPEDPKALFGMCSHALTQSQIPLLRGEALSQTHPEVWHQSLSPVPPSEAGGAPELPPAIVRADPKGAAKNPGTEQNQSKP